MGKRPSVKSRTYGVKLVRGPFVRLNPHSESHDDEESWLDWVRSIQGPTVADLFCGAGGLSLGLTRAGFSVVMGIDQDKEALETHRSIFPGLTVDWDLSDDHNIQRTAELIREAEVTAVAGGPPCQPFSKAGRSMLRDLVRSGRRAELDARRDLGQSFLRIISLARPSAVIMENVPDMALERDMMILRTMVDELEHLGYAVEGRVMETWRYGVPQFRSRLIIVGLRDGLAFDWPSASPDRVTVENAIGDLPDVEGGWRPEGGADGWAPYGGPLTRFQRSARADVDSAEATKVFDQITRPVRDDDAAAFAQMDSSTKYSDLDPDLKRYREDIFNDKYKRLNPHDLSRTITAHIAKDGYWYIHPYQDRTLTVREAARLQTFPDHVRFAGPPTAAFRQIGNAVPPALAEAVGAALLQSLTAAIPATATSRDVAAALGKWFSERPELTVPWLRAENRWQVIEAEILLGRARTQDVKSLWPLISQMTTPAETLARRGQLLEIASWIGRSHRAEQVLAAAGFYVAHPEALETADRLTDPPEVSSATANLALRVVDDPFTDPVLTTHGTLRVAARFTGEPVDRINKRSDGRLAVARMVGGDPSSDVAHRGLIELAAAVCRPRGPDCGSCPLNSWCVEARTVDRT